MRVTQNLFDYGETGILAVSTHHSTYGLVPAAAFGQALLWRNGTSADLFELCTRVVDADTQTQAMTALRNKLRYAAERVRKQLAWSESRMTGNARELPCFARQMGGSQLLLGFVGAIQPRCWRLIDVAQQRVIWESTPDMAESVFRRMPAKFKHASFMTDSQLPLASGVNFVEIQLGMCRVVYVVDDGQLVATEWSLTQQNCADNYGLRSGMLSQPDRDQNVYVLLDPRTGETLTTFAAPTASKHWSRPATALGSDRIAISHHGGTVDIVDGFGSTFFSIRPFAQVARTEAISVQLSHNAEWLGAEGWSLFRVVNLQTREVAELPVPEPNMQDDPERVLHDRAVLATDHGVALMDQSGLAVIAYADLHWQPVVAPARGVARKKSSVFKKHLDHWRKPALALKPSKSGRSWLYGAPDLPASAVPQHVGLAMQLLARIDLAEVSSLLAEHPWPKHGTLYFFTAVDAEGAPLQDELFNLNATRVIWWNGALVSEPSDGQELAAKQPLHLIPHSADLPDITAAIVDATMLDEVDVEAYRAWLEAQHNADQPNGHRLGGYPTILQRNDLEAQAAHFADDAPYPSGDMAETSAASRWRLLLQLDSDHACMWGTDSGILYFLIHDDDLARQDFSRVVAVCEGL